ncbi:MAG TPA: hypothetical protein PLC32_06030 [Candidatus Omnitrophota bacterium]|nr:hypothetical protein [Candidatus Omnitrophota bacterium]
MMKKTIFVLILFLLCVSVSAEENSGWLIFSQSGLNVSIVSQGLSSEEMSYSYNSPTAVDGSGNFYYCVSEGNPNGYLWMIKKVDNTSGKVSEVCRLNLDKYKTGSIKAINSSGDSLYVWVTLAQSGSRDWISALVEISGL